MSIKRPDIYEHNNPNEPIVDTDFVRGGFRTKVADLPALYALAPKVSQMKEHATSVWVISENKYYTLVDASNVGNSSGWSDSILGGNGVTNLAYTPSPTNGIVTSDTGTDATIPLADATNAGLFAPAEKTKLTGIAENANNYVHPNHSGDVTSVGDGVQTIANEAVTNAKFRNSTAHTVVGRAGAGNGSVADITLGNDTILGRQGSGNVQGLSVSQVQSILNFDSKQNIPIVRTTDFTPALNTVNNVTANAIVTDPTPVEGLGYTVNVISGVATVGGIAYPSRTSIFRSWNGSAWVNEVKASLVGNNVPLENLTDSEEVYGIPFVSRVGKFFRSLKVRWNETTGELRIDGLQSILRVISTTGDGNAGIQVRDTFNIAYRFFDSLGDFATFGTTNGKRLFRFFTAIRQFSGSNFVETEFISVDATDTAETTLMTYTVPNNSVLTIGCLNLNCYNSQDQMIFGRAQFSVKNVGGTLTDISRDELRYGSQYSEIVSGYVTNANSRIDIVISGTNVELRFRQTGTARATTVQLEVKRNISLKPE